MLTRLFPILSVASCIIFLTNSAHAGEVGFATGEGMNLRTQATSSSGIICNFKTGDKVEIRWTDGDWHFVKSVQSESCKIKQGYMHKSVLSFDDPTNSDQPLEPVEDDLRDEDHAHAHEGEHAPHTSPIPVSRESILDSRMETLSNHDFENKSFRYIVTKSVEVQSRPMSRSGNKKLCKIKTGTKVNLAGSLTDLYGFVKIEDEDSSCNGTQGYVLLKSIDSENLRTIKGTNVRIRETPDKESDANISCNLDNPNQVVLVEKVDPTWSKIYVKEDSSEKCKNTFGFVHSSLLTYKTLKKPGSICGDSRIINVSVSGWGKQKIGTAWVAKWEEKFCPALRGMANEFGKVEIVSGVRPFSENIARGGAGCSKHRLRWKSNGQHVGCGRGKDLGSLGGALDLKLPGVWGNYACNDQSAIRSQRRAYNFIRRYKDFRVNVYKSGRIHIGLLAHRGASRVPYSTCVR